MMRRSTLVLVAGFLAAAGCGDSPAAPSAPVGPAEVTLTSWPSTAPVYSQVFFQFHLSRPVDFGVDIWTETRSPTYDWRASGTAPLVHFAPGTVQSRRLSTGIPSTPEAAARSIGDWGLRIIGDRLPDGVVLGDPSEVAWTVVP